jgi:hypothetical protein
MRRPLSFGALMYVPVRGDGRVSCVSTVPEPVPHVEIVRCIVCTDEQVRAALLGAGGSLAMMPSSAVPVQGAIWSISVWPASTS